MARFAWGRVIENIEIPFNNGKMAIVKYHPYLFVGSISDGKTIDEDKILYSCPEISQSANTLESLVLHWIAHKKLGLNHGALVYGVERALGL
jgi:hypothetical protein